MCKHITLLILINEVLINDAKSQVPKNLTKETVIPSSTPERSISHIKYDLECDEKPMELLKIEKKKAECDICRVGARIPKMREMLETLTGKAKSTESQGLRIRTTVTLERPRRVC